MASASKAFTDRKPCFLQSRAVAKLTKVGFHHQINSSATNRALEQQHPGPKETNKSCAILTPDKGWGFPSRFPHRPPPRPQWPTCPAGRPQDEGSLAPSPTPTPRAGRPGPSVLLPVALAGKQEASSRHLVLLGFKGPEAEEGEPGRAVLSAARAKGGFSPSTHLPEKKAHFIHSSSTRQMSKKLCFYY